MLVLWPSPGSAAARSEQIAASPQLITPGTVSAATDPYAPLRLYDGKWDLLPASGDKPGATVHIENRCAKVGEFFACNQIVNGKNMALVIFCRRILVGVAGTRTTIRLWGWRMAAPAVGATSKSLGTDGSIPATRPTTAKRSTIAPSTFFPGRTRFILRCNGPKMEQTGQPR